MVQNQKQTDNSICQTNGMFELIILLEHRPYIMLREFKKVAFVLDVAL